MKKALFHFTLVYANPNGNDRLSKLMTGQLKLNAILDRVELRPLVWAVLIIFLNTLTVRYDSKELC